MNMRLAPFLAAALLAGACAPACAEEDWTIALGLQPNTPILVLPAAAGAVVDMQQRLTGDAFTQTTIFQGDPLTPSQNVLIATVTRGGLAAPIASEDIDSEMEDRLPGIAMNVSLFPGRDVFGVFGYALGSKGPVACLYAWQGMTNADTWITGRTTNFFGEHHALSLRIRLCRTGMTAKALLGLAQGVVRAALPQMRMRMAGHVACYGLFSNFAGSCARPAPVAMTMAPEPMVMAGLTAEPELTARRPFVSRKTPPKREVEAIRRQPEPAKPLAGMPVVPLPQ
jgi:Cellulose biosynthesis protein BcsN